MRYSVLGYNQAKAVELGLKLSDLAILHWVQELSARASSKTTPKDGKIFYWVNYNTLIEDLPVLRAQKKTIYRGFAKLVERGLLEHYYLTDGGAFSYYRLTEKVEELTYSNQSNTPRTKMSEGRSEMSEPPGTKMSDQRLIYDNKLNSNTARTCVREPSWEDVMNVYDDE